MAMEFAKDTRFLKSISVITAAICSILLFFACTAFLTFVEVGLHPVDGAGGIGYGKFISGWHELPINDISRTAYAYFYYAALYWILSVGAGVITLILAKSPNRTRLIILGLALSATVFGAWLKYEVDINLAKIDATYSIKQSL